MSLSDKPNKRCSDYPSPADFMPDRPNADDILTFADLTRISSVPDVYRIVEYNDLGILTLNAHGFVTFKIRPPKDFHDKYMAVKNKKDPGDDAYAFDIYMAFFGYQFDDFGDGPVTCYSYRFLKRVRCYSN